MHEATREYLGDVCKVLGDSLLNPIEIKEMLGHFIDHAHATGQLFEIEYVSLKKGLDCDVCGGVMLLVDQHRGIWECRGCERKEER